MKKNLLLILAFVCCITVFTSCGDDAPKGPISAVSGTWKTAPYKMTIPTDPNKDPMFESGPVYMAWEAPEGTLLGFLYLKDIPTLAEGLGGRVLSEVLQEITLHDNGDISATYSDAGISNPLDPEAPPVVPVWKNSGKGYATYKENVKGKSINVFLNLKKIIGDNPEDIKMIEEALKEFPIVNEMITKGIPVNYAFSTDKKTCRLYIDKAFMDKLIPLIPEILSQIPDEGLGGMAPMIKMMLGAVPEAMKVTTKFELGLNLTK
ncbi:MAG: DUF4925 domain-containing protein [Muribaculaceae bacterium]